MPIYFEPNGPGERRPRIRVSPGLACETEWARKKVGRVGGAQRGAPARRGTRTRRGDAPEPLEGKGPLTLERWTIDPGSGQVSQPVFHGNWIPDQ